MTITSSTLLPRERAGVRWWEFSDLGSRDRLLAVVSTRRGGVSDGGFESLNLSLTVGDDPGRVVENRRRFFDAIRVDSRYVSYVRQVHGRRVVEPSRRYVTEVDSTAPIEADAQMTDFPDIALFLTYADCVPLVVYDPRHAAIGLAHAGWRGTLSGVGLQLVSAMQGRFGCRPGDLRVGIGPSIGPCCFDVGDDVGDQFRNRWPDRRDIVTRSEAQMRIDLWAANRLVMTDAGVPTENIESCQICTACHHEEFFSHRRQQGTAGRFATVVGLR